MSQLFNFSPELIARVRQLYEESDMPVVDICKMLSVSRNTLHRRAKNMNWTLRNRNTARKGMRAASKHREVIARIRDVVEQEIGAIEAAVSSVERQNLPADPERAARTLASLVKTLNELKRLEQAAHTPEPQHDAQDDIDTLRQTLAQRLDRLAEETGEER